MKKTEETPEPFARPNTPIRKTAARLIQNERGRQEHKGYTAANDDAHTAGQLVEAAVAHIQQPSLGIPQIWPFACPFKPAATRKEALIIGAALLVAEIERILRAEAAAAE